jgi:hypothetical protein
VGRLDARTIDDDRACRSRRYLPTSVVEKHVDRHAFTWQGIAMYLLAARRAHSSARVSQVITRARGRVRECPRGGRAMKATMVVRTAVVLALVAGTVTATRRGEPAVSKVKTVLRAPPQVPPPIQRSRPAKVVVELETTEQRGTLASGVE